jgi:dihydrolipoamide dehydrogenase
MRGVFAIGDLVGEPMLAHKASAQGKMVAEIIAGQRRSFDPVPIPAVCFTDPEIVAVGLSPDDAAQRGIEAVSGRFPFAASGRAMTLTEVVPPGFVRVVATKADHRILGFQAVGIQVSELSAAFVQALEMGALLEDAEVFIEAHPTLGEVAHEAVLGALGRSLHLPRAADSASAKA